MNVRYVVTLSADERRELEALVSGGAKLVRVAKRAQILLAAADGETDERISKLVRVGTSTVYRTKRRCVEEGIEEAIHDGERVGAAEAQREGRGPAGCNLVLEADERSSSVDDAAARR